MKVILAALLLLVILGNSQECLNHKGQKVDWFAILTTPRSVADAKGTQGYHYFDSNSNELSYWTGFADLEGHPLYNTLQQLKDTKKYSVVSWNDQILDKTKSQTTIKPKPSKRQVNKRPNPQGHNLVGTIDYAHAKAIIGYNFQDQTGIIVSHTCPNFPNFLENKQIDYVIYNDQRKFGQNIFCFNSGKNTRQILEKTNLIIPQQYINTKNDKFQTISSNLFQQSNFNAGESQIKIIYKNGIFNSSVLHEGLTQMLQSSLIAQTWDRSSSTPWCASPFKLEIAKQLYFENESLSWTQGQDHSKWVIPTDQNNHFACFGDVNVMESQFKRGGAFYCVKNEGLKKAIYSIIKKAYLCPGSQSPFQPWTPSTKSVKAKKTVKSQPKRRIPKAAKFSQAPQSIQVEQESRNFKTEKVVEIKKGRSIKISLDITITQI